MQLLISLLYKWSFSLRKGRQAEGFTLLELLISLIIASMVVSGLLYVVVELTKIDKREASLDQVQRDMKRAVDYIADDLREAVYVYTDPTIVATQLATDSSFPSGTDVVPILAFWRVDPLENIPDCSSFANESDRGLCEVLEIRQAAYTLVVYSQRLNSPSNQNWVGQSRIIRYELPRYTAAGLQTLTQRNGYRDPTKQGDPKALFKSWKVDDVGGVPEVPNGNAAVLVDFVQHPDLSIELDRPPLSDTAPDTTSQPCYSYGVQTDADAATLDIPLYTISPSNANKTINNTFFACVRKPDPTGINAENSNQDVYLFLRGSTQGISGGIVSFSQDSSLPILETRVLVRGVVDKNLR